VLAARHLLRVWTRRAFDARGPGRRTQAHQGKDDGSESQQTTHQTIVRCAVSAVKSHPPSIAQNGRRLGGGWSRPPVYLEYNCSGILAAAPVAFPLMMP